MDTRTLAHPPCQNSLAGRRRAIDLNRPDDAFIRVFPFPAMSALTLLTFSLSAIRVLSHRVEVLARFYYP
eukprot:scaffold5323_cov173-Amphora_coffeaeformis.AAC.2